MVSDNFNNSGNVSNWELGRISVRERKFDDAHRRFLAEVTHSRSANTLVYNDHGHLLNMMGRYDDAIVKFDSFLSSHPDYVSSLFGKGISFIGLNRLDEALSCFDKVLEIDDGHADAWYYSAIIYANPFYHNYNPSLAKERYKKYLDSRENFIKNPNYFKKPFDDLSLEELHDYYEVSDFFILIDQFLDNGNFDEFDRVLKDYGGLYCLEDDLDELLDIFRLFDADDYLVDRIDLFNSNKSIGDRFESAGFDDDLSSRFDGLSIENKKVLVELMDYFKGFRLSLTDINDLIREHILDGEMSLESFNGKREYIVNKRIDENDEELIKNDRENFKIKIAENKQLKEQIVKKDELIKELSKENNDLRRDIQNSEDLNKKLLDQPNRSLDTYDELLEEIKYLMDKYCTDNELLNKMESFLKDDNEDVCSMNIISGINNEDYQEDLEDFKEKYGISEDVLNTFDLTFKDFYEDNFEEPSTLFWNNLRKEFRTDELRNYMLFLKATSFSRNGKLKDAYEIIILSRLKIDDYKKKKEKRQKESKRTEQVEEKEKYPIGWFNFGNICFDYANSQFVKSKKAKKEAYELAYFCYDCAKSSISNLEEKSGYEFNFKDKNSEEDFKNNVSRMIDSRKIYDDLEKFNKLLKIKGDLSKLEELQLEINEDLSELKNSNNNKYN